MNLEEMTIQYQQACAKAVTKAVLVASVIMAIVMTPVVIGLSLSI